MWKNNCEYIKNVVQVAFGLEEKESECAQNESVAVENGNNLKYTVKVK